jgi:hypothetical protein
MGGGRAATKADGWIWAGDVRRAMSGGRVNPRPGACRHEARLRGLNIYWWEPVFQYYRLAATCLRVFTGQ